MIFIVGIILSKIILCYSEFCVCSVMHLLINAVTIGFNCFLCTTIGVAATLLLPQSSRG